MDAVYLPPYLLTLQRRRLAAIRFEAGLPRLPRQTPPPPTASPKPFYLSKLEAAKNIKQELDQLNDVKSSLTEQLNEGCGCVHCYHRIRGQLSYEYDDERCYAHTSNHRRSVERLNASLAKVEARLKELSELNDMLTLSTRLPMLNAWWKVNCHLF